MACTWASKVNGILTVVAIGVAVLVDLWDLLDKKKGYSMVRDLRSFSLTILLPRMQNFFWNHFLARVVGFIVLPLFLYLFFFAVHLGILSNTGPGDAFMSPSFQETLRGNELLLKSHGMFAFCVLNVMHIAHAIGRNPILRYCHY